MTGREFNFLDSLDQYPPVIARVDVSKYFPWLSAKSLANLDAKQEGPEQSYKNGRAVLYPTRSLLEWLNSRMIPIQSTRNGGNKKTEGVEGQQKIRPRRGRKSKSQEVRERRK